MNQLLPGSSSCPLPLASTSDSPRKTEFVLDDGTVTSNWRHFVLVATSGAGVVVTVFVPDLTSVPVLMATPFVFMPLWYGKCQKI